MKKILYESNNQQKSFNYRTFIVLDIETALSGEIIQVAYNIYNKNLVLIKEYNVLINENINKVDFFNKYTLKTIKKYGISPIAFLKELANDFDTCKYIICHNVAFDMSRIYKYFEKYKIKLNHKPIPFCTMKNTKHICSVKNIKGKLKNPKLEELYFYCFGVKPDNSKTHSANYDIEITFECLHYLYSKKLITL